MVKQPSPEGRVSLSIDTRCLGARSVGPAAAPTTRPDPFAGSPWRKISDAEWKKRLTPAAFDVLRHEGTEAPGSSPLNDEHRRGLLVCAGCGLPLFKSDWKFDSGTGWPSFFDVFHENIAIKRDTLLDCERAEYHCARCLGHQGHIFHDGPKPTGLRYCNDGGALRFLPA